VLWLAHQSKLNSTCSTWKVAHGQTSITTREETTCDVVSHGTHKSTFEPRIQYLETSRSDVTQFDSTFVTNGDPLTVDAEHSARPMMFEASLVTNVSIWLSTCSTSPASPLKAFG
jgi:hypothetical protein